MCRLDRQRYNQEVSGDQEDLKTSAAATATAAAMLPLLPEDICAARVWLALIWSVLPPSGFY